MQVNAPGTKMKKRGRAIISQVLSTRKFHRPDVAGSQMKMASARAQTYFMVEHFHNMGFRV